MIFVFLLNIDSNSHDKFYVQSVSSIFFACTILKSKHFIGDIFRDWGYGSVAQASAWKAQGPNFDF